jgi:hypothetical protein
MYDLRLSHTLFASSKETVLDKIRGRQMHVAEHAITTTTTPNLLLLMLLFRKVLSFSTIDLGGGRGGRRKEEEGGGRGETRRVRIGIGGQRMCQGVVRCQVARDASVL